MKFKKSLYLGLALILPIGVFLFLKFFGKNEFDVEPLFRETVSINPDCENDYSFPYVIPDSIASAFHVAKRDKLTLMVFTNNNLKEEIQKQVNRIREEFSNDPVVINNVDEMNTNFSYLKNCIFLMQDQLNVALIDNEKRIRGQYDASSLEDMDRLIVEMKIILKQY